MNEEAPPGADTKVSQAPAALTFLMGHIASFSALGAVAAVVCSTLFLYSYLSVFDWRLIWIIDYSDIFNVGLVALAALYTVILVVLTAVFIFLNLSRMKEKNRRTQQILYLSLNGVVGVIFLATVLFFEWQSDTPYQLFTAGGVSALFLLTFVFIIVRLVTSPTPSIAERILGLSSLLILTAGIAGFAFGTVTKYSGGLRYDIFLKDGEMVDVRLVLFTSHHAVFYSSDRVIILPTSDIVKIVARPRQ